MAMVDKNFLIPSILPYLITAIINAAGAAWNADIAAESIQWGKKSIDVTGLGQYIAANDGVKDKSALGTLAMCFVVGLCIAFVWQTFISSSKTKISLLIAGRLNSTKFLR